MNDMKKALIQAIKDFISEDEVLSDEYLRDAATNFVYEHDDDIRDILRDSIDIDDCFSEILHDITYWEIF